MSEQEYDYKIFKIRHTDWQDQIFITNYYNESFDLIEDEVYGIQNFNDEDISLAKTLYPDTVYDLGRCTSVRQITEKALQVEALQEVASINGISRKSLKKYIKEYAKSAYQANRERMMWQDEIPQNFALWLGSDDNDPVDLNYVQHINDKAVQCCMGSGGYEWKGFAIFQAKEEGLFYLPYRPITKKWSKKQYNKFLDWVATDEAGPVVIGHLIVGKDMTGVYTGDVIVGTAVGFAYNKIDSCEEIDRINSSEEPRYLICGPDKEWTDIYRKSWRAREAQRQTKLLRKRVELAKIIVKKREQNASESSIGEEVHSFTESLSENEILELIQAYDPMQMACKHLYQQDIDTAKGKTDWSKGASVQVKDDPESGLLRLATGTNGAALLLKVKQPTVRTLFKKGVLSGIKDNTIWIWLDSIEDYRNMYPDS
ncbi:MAG: hypothetical protein K9M96_05235 [Deltaproteobacteria bacterium]|nr:hypothetical protein [Deltaproteobacteria bacterium]